MATFGIFIAIFTVVAAVFIFGIHVGQIACAYCEINGCSEDSEWALALKRARKKKAIRDFKAKFDAQQSQPRSE